MLRSEAQETKEYEPAFVAFSGLRIIGLICIIERLTAAPSALTMLVSLAAVNLLIKERDEVKNP